MKEKGEEASDLFLKERMQLITETPQRRYYGHDATKTLLASWKAGLENECHASSFQNNALVFVQLMEQKKPLHIVFDCRNLGFEISPEEQNWYIQQTKSTWTKNNIKKVALIFKDNLSVQVGMESLMDMAREEGMAPYPFRIFDAIPDAFNWIKTS
jgi:hypothetical protein